MLFRPAILELIVKWDMKNIWMQLKLLRRLFVGLKNI